VANQGLLVDGPGTYAAGADFEACRANVDALAATPAQALERLAFTSDGRPRERDELRSIFGGISGEFPPEDLALVELAARYDWRLWARAKQTEPPGTWRWWFLLSGRGFG
jgi:hypothetical protein